MSYDCPVCGNVYQAVCDGLGDGDEFTTECVGCKAKLVVICRVEYSLEAYELEEPS